MGTRDQRKGGQHDLMTSATPCVDTQDFFGTEANQGNEEFGEGNRIVMSSTSSTGAKSARNPKFEGKQDRDELI